MLFVACKLLYKL